MAKPKVDPIVIENELPMAVSHAADVPENITLAIDGQAARIAPSLDDVLAYFTPGRTPMERDELMAEHQVKCADCDTMLHYIPAAGEATPVLTCGKH